MVVPPSGQLIELGAVVGGGHHDRVVLEAQFFELGEDLADMPVVLDHAVAVDAQAGLADGFLLEMREDVHPGGVPPQEKRLVRLLGALHEVDRLGIDLFVDRLHAFSGQRAGVGDATVGSDASGSPILGNPAFERWQARKLASPKPVKPRALARTFGGCAWSTAQQLQSVAERVRGGR